MRAKARTPAIALFSLVTAALCAAQAASNIMARANPALAGTLSPFAARALERAATERLGKDSISAGKLAIDDATVREARLALAKGLQSPEAATIIALSQGVEARRRAILLAAAGLSQRGRLLQGALLQHYSQAGDLDGALSTLDRIMTVHPALQQALMPVMASHLAQPGSVPAFQHILALRPAWADTFLRAAVRDPKAAANLGQLRLALGSWLHLQEETESAILRALVRGSQTDAAARLYTRLKEEQSDGEPGAVLNWSTGLAPFGWALTDKPGLSARPEMNALDGIAIRIEKGNGGVLAMRLVTVPREAKSIIIEHRILPVSQRDDVHVTLTCANDGQHEKSTDFTVTPAVLPINDRTDCPIRWLRISGRAWSTMSDIHGRILQVRFGH